MLKRPPEIDKMYSLEAEAAVLGSMMLDSDCIPLILAVITKTSMFFVNKHKLIFDAIITLHISNKPADAITLRAILKDSNHLKEIGGVEYIGKILESVPSASNAVYYAKIVREKCLYRRIVETVEKISKIPDSPGSANEQIEDIHKLALGLQIESEDEVHEFKTEVFDAVKSLKDKHDCLPTGFIHIDKIIRGVMPGEMIVLAGRPGHGKSALALDITMNTTKKDYGTVIFFELEMSCEALMQRAICAEASIDVNRWGDEPPEEEYKALNDAAELLQNRKISIYETIDTPEKMYAITSIHTKNDGVDLVCIDNIQIMTTSHRIDKEYERLSEISRKLKRMAVMLNVPVLVISHLNREVEKRTNRRPRISDLRGSGSLEQDADIVILLYREDQYRKMQAPDIDPNILDGLAEVIVAKNRRGPTGIARLLFREEYFTFANLAPEYIEDQNDGCPI